MESVGGVALREAQLLDSGGLTAVLHRLVFLLIDRSGLRSLLLGLGGDSLD